jgi:nitrogen regulatory protein P-II 1
VKKIEAFIRHEAFEPIRSELLDKGFPSLSISEVKGSGRQKGLVEAYRGSAVTVSVRPKLTLEVIVRDEDTGTIAETIIRHARSGEIGDGKIFVMPVEEAIRIRTGEEGEEVLQAHGAEEVSVNSSG